MTSDRYHRFANSRVGGVATKRLGLPRPADVVMWGEGLSATFDLPQPVV